jgi:hypothetical protein
MAKKPDPRTLTQHEVAVFEQQKVPGFEGLRVHTAQTADIIADDIGLKSTFNYDSALSKSTLTLDEILSAPLFHGGNLPMRDGKIALADQASTPKNWYGGQMFASEDYRQAVAYLLKSSENSIYSVKSALKKEDVIDLRHNANTLSSQQPYVFAQLLKDIESGKIKLKEDFSINDVLLKLIGQEGGRYPHASSPGALRDNIFQSYLKDPSRWLAEYGIKGIVHRQGTRVQIPEVGRAVTDNPTRTQDFGATGTDAIAYTTVKDSISEIQKYSITNQMVKDLIARLAEGKTPGTIESQILGMLRNPKLIPHKALGGLISMGTLSIPKFHDGGQVHTQFAGGETMALLKDKEHVLTPQQWDILNSRNSSGGDRIYQIAPVINASEGMDVQALADIATRKTLDAIKTIQYNERRTSRE